jgi:hypothetical protein
MATKTQIGRGGRWRWPVRAAGVGAMALAALPLVPSKAGADETLYMGGFHEGTTYGGCGNCTWVYFNESMPFDNGGDFGEMSFSNVRGIVQSGYTGSAQPSKMDLVFRDIFNGAGVSVSTGGISLGPTSEELVIDSGNVTKTSTVDMSWQDWSAASWGFTSVNAVATLQVWIGQGPDGEISACDSMDDSWLNADHWTDYPGAC